MRPPQATLVQSRLPLPLLRRGKVREVYEVDDERLLIVASDRVSAFDVVMREPVPQKGAVLTQISAYWFQRLSEVFPSHYLSARTADIVDQVPELAGVRAELAGRSMLVRRAPPVPFECVVRGYLSGSAWAEYRARGTLDEGDPVVDGRPAELLEFWGQRGHEVTLFASGDSRTRANLDAVFPRAPSARIGQTFWELQHALNCFARHEDFDVIHDHTTPGPLSAW